MMEQVEREREDVEREKEAVEAERREPAQREEAPVPVI